MNANVFLNGLRSRKPGFIRYSAYSDKPATATYEGICVELDTLVIVAETNAQTHLAGWLHQRALSNEQDVSPVIRCTQNCLSTVFLPDDGEGLILGDPDCTGEPPDARFILFAECELFAHFVLYDPGLSHRAFTVLVSNVASAPYLAALSNELLGRMGIDLKKRIDDDGERT